MSKKKAAKPIYTLDAETDPFLEGRIPVPFAWCLCRKSATPSQTTNGGYVLRRSWGADCTAQIVQELAQLPSGIVYIHNGGRFDIHFLWDFLTQEREPSINKNRVVVCYIESADGYHEIRDSYKIFPAGLAEYKKTEIDYRKFEKECREDHKQEILDYLDDDCIFLHQIVSAFIDKFGKAYLTVGSCATSELKRFYDLGEKFTPELDEDMRQYYFGARVQCFEKGIIAGDLRSYDVNSMYPFVMATYQHPLGHPSPHNNRCITDDTFFITVEGKNKGAFISRTKQGKTFDLEDGVFNVTIHEWNAALELGLFEPRNILRTVDFPAHGNFADFVQHFYADRQIATDRMERLKDAGQKYSTEWYAAKLEKDFNKNLLNNSYGKQAINPANYYRYLVTGFDACLYVDWCERNNCCEVGSYESRQYACGGWHRCGFDDVSGRQFWRKPSQRVQLNNVAIGASITGAARSYLLRGISAADRPIYCDTDSIMCVGDLNMPVHSSNLGAWKLEYKGSELAVYGKKGYALFDAAGVCLKSASKGAQLTPAQIVEVAQGNVVHYVQQAPCFSLTGEVSWIQRNIRIT